ncbi:ATP-dependent DNA ligase [Zongyangia hominis]|nr:RNA ligase family protein [Zongyangia hominis]
MDLFEAKDIQPMLIGESKDLPFVDGACIYELKLDGERCLAYLDKEGTELKNKRNDRMLPKFPELKTIHKQVKKRCILDGELIVILNNRPDFSEVQRRSLMSNSFKIELALKKAPASFVAFDILYYEDHPVMDLPLMERKKLLCKVVRAQNERFAVSRVMEGGAADYFEQAKALGLEGIVVKYRESKYYPGKRTKDWIKVKNLLDDDFVVCGYIHKEQNVVSIVLGQYEGKTLLYKGHVTLGLSREAYEVISTHPRITAPKFEAPKGNEDAIWIKPDLVCTVKYMEKTASGGLRQPVFKGLRPDKKAKDCVVQ